MKKLARKLLAMLLTAAIAVSGLVVTTVTAGAESIADKAIELEPMEFVSKNFEEQSDSEYYEIKLTKPGNITLRFGEINRIDWRFMDSNGNELSSGSSNHPTGCNYKNFTRDIKDINKGTYYLCIIALNDKSTQKEYSSYSKDFYYSFSPSEKPIISISATLKKGATLQFGSVTENYDGKVTWVSTKKTVATVSSKGLVTAKKAGTTYIRAQLDNGDYVEIKVVVKNK